MSEETFAAMLAKQEQEEDYAKRPDLLLKTQEGVAPRPSCALANSLGNLILSARINATR